MSIPFPQDTSVQLTYSSFPFPTPLLDNYTTSNYVSNISNLLINNINTKQATLTSATNLLGVGSAITDIDYNKITINKPTNFQSDWNSTVVNKPPTFPADMTNIYNKGETNTLLNAKQNTLTAATNLLGIGSSITNINYATLSNVPLTFPADMTNIYNKTETNTLVSSTWTKSGNDIYTTSPGNVGININNPLGGLEVGGFNAAVNKVKFGHMNRWSTNQLFCSIFFRFLSAEPNIIAYFGYVDSYDDPVNRTMVLEITRTSLNMTGNITASGTISEGGTLLTSKYLQLAGGNMTGALTVPNITLGSNGKINSYDDYHYIEISQPTDTLTIQEFGTISFNIGQTKTQKAFINSTGLTVNGTCSATTFSGSGASLTNIPYASITGLPATFPATMTNIYTKTETDTLLNAKEAILTFSSPLIRTTNTISLNQSLISYNNLADRPDLNLYFLKSGGAITGNLTTTGNVGIGITNPFAMLNLGTPAVDGSTGTLVISRRAAAFGFRNFRFGYDNSFNFCMGDFGDSLSGNIWTSNQFNINWQTGNIGIGIASQTQKLYVNGTTFLNNNTTINGTCTATTFSGSGASLTSIPYANITGLPTNFQSDWNSTVINRPDLNLYLLKSGDTMTGNLGIGTTNNANATLELYSTTQLTPRIILSGKEYFESATAIASGGIAFLCGVNRTGNRQLWIGDSLLLAQNTTNPVLRISIGSSAAAIDCVATNGTTSLPIFFGSTSATTNIRGSSIITNGNIGIGTTNPGTYNLNVNGSSRFTFIDIINPDGRATHFPFGSGGQNYIRGPVNIDQDDLRFGNRISNFLINLWSVNEYGFGINGGMLRYNSNDRHTFFSGGAERVNFSSLGVITCGGITANGGGYIGGNITTSFTTRCGIGISPSAKLHIASGLFSTGSIFQRYLSIILGDGSATQTLTDVCAIFGSSVWCKSRYTVSSDERIKPIFKILMMMRHYKRYY